MKFSEYLRDHLAVYIIFIAAMVLEISVLFAFHVLPEAVVIVSVTEIISLFSVEAWGFFRKRGYYKKLFSNLESLDKKYLLPEMLDQPEFLEGKIIYEILRETNKSMCENVSEYRRMSEDFREFLELWVHEIKLPVASLELMCHNDGNSKYMEQISRIDTYIENVLYYARSGNPEKDYIIKEVSLKQIFTECAVRYREELQERGISIEASGLDKKVMTDGKWLLYMIGQLMVNSMKYGAKSITVTADVAEDMTVLHFRDDGIGISANDLPHIFEKSFTGENGRAHAKSTGMGLYIVKKLCGKLGHGISASSKKGEYTEISIAFGKNSFIEILK